MKNKIKLSLSIFALDIVGTIDANPLKAYGNFGDEGGGVVGLITNILRLIFVAGGVYALINFIVAGFVYMSAAGDPKKLITAWARIWQTLIGLLLVVASFAFAALFGYLFFKNPLYILEPQIYGPDTGGN